MLDVLSNIFEHPFVKALGTLLVLVSTYLFGDFDMVLQAMILAVLSDFILWFLIALWEWKFSKLKFYNGLKKEMTFACAIIIGNLADKLIFHAEVEWGVQNFFIVYIGINELLSSLRHLAKLWFRTPEAIVKRLYKESEEIKF